MKKKKELIKETKYVSPMTQLRMFFFISRNFYESAWLVGPDNFNIREFRATRAEKAQRVEASPPDSERTMLHVRRTGCSGSRGISRISRVRDDGFTAAWQRGQAPSQTNQPAATRGAYRGSDDPLRSEPLSQRRAPPLAPSNVYIGCPAPADIIALPCDSAERTIIC